MKKTLLSLFCLLCVCALRGQQTPRPKIGLTLSGGGAKGLAHIGILKALDSAGLKVDYITGTSMGAIIGSLYAIGYSGEQIEKMARKIDWDLLLSNQLSLRLLAMEEKEEYGKYAVELPYVNNRLQLPNGILEGQELWLKLSQLYYPVHAEKDFDKFPIPFRCIATDVATGQAVVLRYGDLTTAVRASMAIPSVFASVDYDGYRLVDGGVVRNFPVRDVREMGADIVIGSSVASGLASKDKLVSAVDVLLQMAFFKEAEDYKQEVKLCDYFVFQPLEKYSMGSFNNANKLIDIGNKEGREMYAEFKALADSLNIRAGSPAQNAVAVLAEDSVYISSYEINGLEKTSASFFIHAMDFRTNRNYSEQMISKMIRRVFGSRYYSSVTYSLVRAADQSFRIVFTVKENASTYLKAGIHYNDFSGIGVIGNITTRDFFTPYSRSLATVSIGENLRLRGEHLQYFGLRKNIGLIPKFQMESFKINTYNGFNKSGLYRQLYYMGELRAQYSGVRGFTPGIGTRYEWLSFKPLIESNFEAKGKNNFVTSFVFMNVNTVDKAYFPRRGFNINAEFGVVYDQRPRVNYFSNGVPISNIDSLGIDFGNYTSLLFQGNAYAPMSPRFTFHSLVQLGINFNYRQTVVNSYLVGGLVETMRNQILFAGLEEGTIRTPSVASAMIGLNYQLSKNIYLKARSNALVQNFVSPDRQLQLNNWLSGHALSFAYNTPLGPLEFSLTYSDQSRKTLTYVNFGIPF